LNKTKVGKVLEELSLTNYEITIMEYLYQFGQAKADEIHSETGIPLSRVYETMDQLVSKGFVIIQDGRPRTFIVRDPTETAENIIQDEERKAKDRIDKLNRSTNELINIILPIYLEKNTLISPEDLLTQYTGLNEAEIKTKEMINKAIDSIEIFTNVFHWFHKIEKEIIAAFSRGVKVRIIIQNEIPQDLKLIVNRNENIEVRLMRQIQSKSRGTIIDSKEVIFIIWANEPDIPLKSHIKKRIYRPQFSSNEGIVSVFQNNFEYLWMNSTNELGGI
jgi:HTH-type transcriptional regulator, sugar sensing transcriptional regulator